MSVPVTHCFKQSTKISCKSIQNHKTTTQKSVELHNEGLQRLSKADDFHFHLTYFQVGFSKGIHFITVLLRLNLFLQLYEPDIQFSFQRISTSHHNHLQPKTLLQNIYLLHLPVLPVPTSSKANILHKNTAIQMLVPINAQCVWVSNQLDAPSETCSEVRWYFFREVGGLLFAAVQVFNRSPQHLLKAHLTSLTSSKS